MHDCYNCKFAIDKIYWHENESLNPSKYFAVDASTSHYLLIYMVNLYMVKCLNVSHLVADGSCHILAIWSGTLATLPVYAIFFIASKIAEAARPN